MMFYEIKNPSTVLNKLNSGIFKVFQLLTDEHMDFPTSISSISQLSVTPIPVYPMPSGFSGHALTYGAQKLMWAHKKTHK